MPAKSSIIDKVTLAVCYYQEGVSLAKEIKTRHGHMDELTRFATVISASDTFEKQLKAHEIDQVSFRMQLSGFDKEMYRK